MITGQCTGASVKKVRFLTRQCTALPRTVVHVLLPQIYDVLIEFKPPKISLSKGPLTQMEISWYTNHLEQWKAYLTHFKPKTEWTPQCTY